jgi:hypothetical protein
LVHAFRKRDARTRGRVPSAACRPLRPPRSVGD